MANHDAATFTVIVVVSVHKSAAIAAARVAVAPKAVRKAERSVFIAHKLRTVVPADEATS